MRGNVICINLYILQNVQPHIYPFVPIQRTISTKFYSISIIIVNSTMLRWYCTNNSFLLYLLSVSFVLFRERMSFPLLHFFFLPRGGMWFLGNIQVGKIKLPKSHYFFLLSTLNCYEEVILANCFSSADVSFCLGEFSLGLDWGETRESVVVASPFGHTIKFYSQWDYQNSDGQFTTICLSPKSYLTLIRNIERGTLYYILHFYNSNKPKKKKEKEHHSLWLPLNSQSRV